MMTKTTRKRGKKLKNTFATDMNVSFMLGITFKLIAPLFLSLRHLSLKDAFKSEETRGNLLYAAEGRKGIKSNPQKKESCEVSSSNEEAKAITFHKFNNMTSIVRAFLPCTEGSSTSHDGKMFSFSIYCLRSATENEHIHTHEFSIIGRYSTLFRPY